MVFCCCVHAERTNFSCKYIDGKLTAYCTHLQMKKTSGPLKELNYAKMTTFSDFSCPALPFYSASTLDLAPFKAVFAPCCLALGQPSSERSSWLPALCCSFLGLALVNQPRCTYCPAFVYLPPPSKCSNWQPTPALGHLPCPCIC